MNKARVIPNPHSKLLSKAVVGGAGLILPPAIQIPEGMAMVLLLVPMEEILGKTMPEIQDDLGIPWHDEGGPDESIGVWLDELL